MDVFGDESKIQCCKEQYCIGTWDVRSVNQGKLDMVKQEMVRINIDIVGISGLKYTEMGEFNFSSVQSLSRVQLFVTPRTLACQVSLSITNSQSLLKLIVHQVGDAIQPPHPLLPPSPPAFSLSQYQGLFQ